MRTLTTLAARRAKRLQDQDELQKLRVRVKELFEQVVNLKAENFYLRELTELLKSEKP